MSLLAVSAHDNQSGLDLASPPSTRAGGGGAGGAPAARVVDVPLRRATAAALAGLGVPVPAFATAPCAIVPFPLVRGWRPLVPGTGDEGGVVEDVFTSTRVGRVQLSENVGLARKYVIGWYGDDPADAAAEAAALEAAAAAGDKRPRDDDAAAAAAPPGTFDSILTHEANYHPDGGQVFCSRGAPFVLLLAPPGDDVKLEHFRAFLVDPAWADPALPPGSPRTVGVSILPGVWHQPAFPAVSRRASPYAPEERVLDNRQGRVHGCVAVDFVREFGAYLRVPLTPEAADEGERRARAAAGAAGEGAAGERAAAGSAAAAAGSAAEGAAAEPPAAAAAAAAATPSPSSSPAAPVRLGYVILYVASPAAAAAFYAAAFGLRAKFCTPAGDYAEVGTCSGTALGFASTALAAASARADAAAWAAGGRAAPSEVALVVPDVDAAFQRAVAAGAQPAAPPASKPWGQRVAYVRDGDGFLVELCSAMD